MKKKRRLSGAIKVEQWSKGGCFREFRGRPNLIETCLEAIKNTTGLVVSGKADYFSDAVAMASKDCMKMSGNDQMACLAGVTEVMLRSKGQTASLEGRYKQQADCTFQCPARGRVDFSVWPRKNETSRDACFRGLRDKAKVDTHQIPFCQPLRIRYIDGTRKLSKAGTRFSPIRMRDLGRLPKVRIVRED